MTQPAEFTETLLVGIAELLDAGGAGVWSASDPYDPASGSAIITLVEIPQEPQRVICLTDYPVEDDPGTTEGIIGLQVRTRGDRNPMTARRLADGVFYLLHGLTGLTFGSGPNAVSVAHIYRESATPIGPDSQGRHERSESYYVHVNRAGPGRD